MKTNLRTYIHACMHEVKLYMFPACSLIGGSALSPLAPGPRLRHFDRRGLLCSGSSQGGGGSLNKEASNTAREGCSHFGAFGLYCLYPVLYK